MPENQNEPQIDKDEEVGDRESRIRDWVFTIIDQSDVEGVLGAVVDILKEEGLELDYIRALSEVQPDAFIRTSAGSSKYSCCEVWGYGSEFNEQRARARLRSLAEERDVDLALRTKAEYERPKRLFCFDMDSTLIQGEVIDELAKLAGVGDQVVQITASAMRGEIDFAESFRRRVALLQGLSEARVLELLGRIPLLQGAERLFGTLHARGAKTAILSGGFTFFGHDVQRRLGIHHVHANVLDIQDGQVTGQVRTEIVDGRRKAELLVEIASREGIPLEEVVAVGDGANDLPMLRLAGLGVAFHAKPVVRAEARVAITHVGLDGLLYLLGIPDREWV